MSLNKILLLICLLSLLSGQVFAKSNIPSYNSQDYNLTLELIQHEAILDIQDLLCIDECEQDTMIAQVTSINQALSVNDGK